MSEGEVEVKVFGRIFRKVMGKEKYKLRFRIKQKV